MAATALALGVGACGGGEAAKTEQADKGAPAQGKQGGTLTSLWASDVDFLDCGRAYLQSSYTVCYATQKPLYSHRPTDPAHMVPDLAASLPEVSNDGKIVTVRIKDGVSFSPPVSRMVTSKDVKYGLERAFFNTVNNGYAGAYFGDLVGAKTGAAPGKTIAGIGTPDDRTVVFELSRPTGGVLAAGALALLATAPVPREYAKKFDAQNPSRYGEHQVATGPYMIENDAAGKTVGYRAGERIHLVRNPSWDRSLDYKPAWLDEIDIRAGNNDVTVAARKILSGDSMVSGDFTPTPQTLKQVATKQKNQLILTPGYGARWIAMNTKSEPFDDLNVRKAVIAGFDRNAMRLTRGGPLVGDMPTHFLPPGVAGFDEAGGRKGPGLDFLNTTGLPDPQLSAGYFKKAGYSAGKYEGKAPLLMVAGNDSVAAKTAEVAKENFTRLGFNVRLRLVSPEVMYTKFCNVPSADVDICPNVAWILDFADGQTMLDPTFNGKNILPQNNSNWSQLDVPNINAAMDKAELLTDPEQRASAWANIDKLVTAHAPGILYVWDKTPVIKSSNVNGVASASNGGFLDYTFTSLK